MSRRVIVEDRHSGEGWAVLLLAALIVAYQGWIVFLVTVVVAVYCVLKAVEAWRRQRELDIVNGIRISIEADHQNMLYNLGDPAGVYGRYDPYTMPMTRQYTRGRK